MPEQDPQTPSPVYVQVAAVKKRKWPWVVGIIAVLAVIGSLSGGAEDGAPSSAKESSETVTVTAKSEPAPEAESAPEVDPVVDEEPAEEAKPDPEPEPTEEAEPAETAGQENARRSAGDYLDYTAFSRSGLIEQLEFEGYSTEDATYGVDTLHASWSKQAAKSAADYLDYTSFSRSGLIDQLEFEGYTASQAEYGVNAAGL